MEISKEEFITLGKLLHETAGRLDKLMNNNYTKYTFELMGDTVKVLEMLFEKVSKKINQIKMQHYIPKHLVLWVGYKNGLHKLIERYNIYNEVYESDLPVRFLGLQIIYTEIPETIEVY